MDLYDVTTTVKEYHGCKNRKISLVAPRDSATTIC